MTTTLNHKNIGYFLVVVSLVLIFLLTFIKFDLDKEGTFLCKAVAANPELDMNECPVHTSNISWLIVVAFGIAFLILGSGIYMIFLPVRREIVVTEKASEGKVTDSSTETLNNPPKIDPIKLDAEEQRIYSLLIERSGSIYQSDMIKETGYSKVKISRILDRMEGKGILERKRRGMTNIVILR